MAKSNPANILLEKHMQELNIPWRKEYRFCAERKWRLDYWLDQHNLAIEIEGSVYANGRHTRGKGFEADCEKYNTATLMGFRVLRFSTGQVLRGEAKEFLKQHLSLVDASPRGQRHSRRAKVGAMES